MVLLYNSRIKKQTSNIISCDIAIIFDTTTYTAQSTIATTTTTTRMYAITAAGKDLENFQYQVKNQRRKKKFFFQMLNVCIHSI